MTCNRCNQQIDSTDRFCRKCGLKLIFTNKDIKRIKILSEEFRRIETEKIQIAKEQKELQIELLKVRKEQEKLQKELFIL